MSHTVVGSYTFGKVSRFSLTNKVEIGNSTLYSVVLDQGVGNSTLYSVVLDQGVGQALRAECTWSYPTPWYLTADQIPDLNPTHCFMGRLDRCFLTPSPLTFTLGLVLLFSSCKELALSISLEATVGPAASAHGPIKSTKWNEHQNLMMLHVETSDVHTVWL